MAPADRPQRTCVGCRQVAPAAQLRRYVLADGVVTPDPVQRLPGRGAWLHDTDECRALARQRHGFARSFRRQADDTELG